MANENGHERGKKGEKRKYNQPDPAPLAPFSVHTAKNDDKRESKEMRRKNREGRKRGR